LTRFFYTSRYKKYTRTIVNTQFEKMAKSLKIVLAVAAFDAHKVTASSSSAYEPIPNKVTVSLDNEGKPINFGNHQDQDGTRVYRVEDGDVVHAVKIANCQRIEREYKILKDACREEIFGFQSPRDEWTSEFKHAHEWTTGLGDVNAVQSRGIYMPAKFLFGKGLETSDAVSRVKNALQLDGVKFNSTK